MKFKSSLPVSGEDEAARIRAAKTPSRDNKVGAFLTGLW